MIFAANYLCELGIIKFICTNNELIGLSFDENNLSKAIKDEKVLYIDNEITLKIKNWLKRYFNRENPSILDIPMKLHGTQFQKRVWNIIASIPYGEVITYKDIARQLEKSLNIKKMSPQAVGRATGKNPIPIIIPCHRVVGKNNNLVGYSGGLDKKIKFLEIENVDLQRYYYYDNNIKKKVIL